MATTIAEALGLVPPATPAQKLTAEEKILRLKQAAPYFTEERPRYKVGDLVTPRKDAAFIGGAGMPMLVVEVPEVPQEGDRWRFEFRAIALNDQNDVYPIWLEHAFVEPWFPPIEGEG